MLELDLQGTDPEEPDVCPVCEIDDCMCPSEDVIFEEERLESEKYRDDEDEDDWDEEDEDEDD